MAKEVRIAAMRGSLEDTAKDKALDRKGARRTGKTLKQYEGSPADVREDAKLKAAARRGKK